MFDDPEQYKNHFAFKKLMEAFEKKDVAQAALDEALAEKEDQSANKYQAFIDQALGSHMETPAKKKAKTSKNSSESSTTSFGVTSVNAPAATAGTVITTDQDRELTTVELAQMQEGAPTLPDGQRMCITTSEYEALVANSSRGRGLKGVSNQKETFD